MLELLIFVGVAGVVLAIAMVSLGKLVDALVDEMALAKDFGLAETAEAAQSVDGAFTSGS